MSKKENTIYIIIVVVLIILVGYFAYIRNNDDTSTTALDGSGEVLESGEADSDSSDATITIETPSEEDDTATTVVEPAEVLGTSASAAATTQVISQTATYLVPVVLEGDKGVNGKLLACNASLVTIPVVGAKTQSVLNETYRQMFGMGESVSQSGRSYANPVALEGLKFDKATITNGLAKVYLMGSIEAGECVGHMQAQVERAALNFATVNSVRTYLNGVELNWSSLIK